MRPEKSPDEHVDLEFAKFQTAIGTSDDSTMLILRGHLFSESLLERLIRLKLPRGDKVLEGASLTYAQKLALVEALDAIPDSIAASLRGLNKLRNQCAHDLGRTVLEADVVRLGSPLGKVFTRTHRECKYDPLMTIRIVLNYVVGCLTGLCHIEEEKVVEPRKRLAAPPSVAETQKDTDGPSV
jgi:hypothetical protein